MLVRSAVPADAERIASVHVRTWQAAYRGQIPDDYLDSLSIEDRAEMWQQILTQPVERAAGWVAESDGEVVGFASVGPSRDDDADETTGEIYAIYVLSTWWGRGAGRLLMEAAEDWLRVRHERATLWVLDTNTRARDFYEALGWRFDGSTKTDERATLVLNEVRYRRILRPGAKT